VLGGVLIVTVLPLLCSAPLAQQDTGKVYKTVDENGRVIFTDKQPSDTSAQLIKVQPTNTTPVVADDSTNKKITEPATSYTRFSITSPANNQTLEYDVSAVDVTLALEPTLQDGHQIQFILDGEPYDEPGTALSTRFGNLSRGTHSVEARVLDAKGKRIKSTRIVKFTVQLHSVQQTYSNDDYYDYPYGVRNPRGADSANGANTPRDVSHSVGAESIEGADSPGYPVPARARARRH
ncbi:MAG TPA: DUF4124 domain-containing protein, partial [Pseudomonadales bacterium]|nr:DUF4124 domain-containing protein [Pseudomonadales bacterium]